MDFEALASTLFEKLSDARQALSLPALLGADAQLENVYSTTITVTSEFVSDNPEVSLGNMNTEFDSIISNADSEAATILLDSRVTHAGVNLTANEGQLAATIQVYYSYLELEPMGPMIDGDLVLQGLSIHEKFGPAFATIEYAPSAGEAFTEVGTIAPWTFMLTPSAGEEGGEGAHKAAQFMIPVSVGEEYRGGEGVVRVQIYIDDVNQVPYEGEKADYDMSEVKRKTLVRAISIDKQSTPGAAGDDAPGPAAESEPVEGGGPESTPAADGAGGAGGGGDAGGGDAGGGAGADENSIANSSVEIERREGGDSPAPLMNDPTASPSTSSPIKRHSRMSRVASTESVRSAIEAEAAVLDATMRVVKDIRIALDYDDMMTLQSEGYELHCTHVTHEHTKTDMEHIWPFHVMASYLDENDTSGVGLEDIAWIKCLKSLGTLPAVPLFEILHDYDLSSEGDDYAIYLAYKVGPQPRFKRVQMITSPIEDEVVLKAYISEFTSVFRQAPAEIGKLVHGPCGLLMMVDGHPDLQTSGGSGSSRSASFHSGKKKSTSQLNLPVYDAEGNLVSDGKTVEEEEEEAPESDVDEESDNDEYEDEEAMIATLMQNIDDTESEKASLLTLNAELQKKAVALITKEKAMQGQTAAARTAAEVVATMVSENPEAALEQNQEKEKQYLDTLQLIVDERQKLSKQLKEFDQLALDLQIRLDDKEVKANGIASSFKQFKKEILSKAQNSRTGHGISQKQIRHFEGMEQKHEEDLERVRLRNISLRTTFRKLERTLRAREQLAEGLHMIDFEQLKIENQTLNEKIEERNEELSKLKRKKTTTVQVLTHIREKLRFVEQANETLAEKLAVLENTIADLRNVVTADKLYRDELRGENKELRAKQGFATSDLLLLDYEARCTKVDNLKASTAELKQRYGVLMRQVNKANRSSASTPWVMSSSQVMK